MHLGSEEPDVEALVTTLKAISSQPEAFSSGAISFATSLAASVITGRFLNKAPSRPPGHCEEQFVFPTMEF